MRDTGEVAVGISSFCSVLFLLMRKEASALSDAKKIVVRHLPKRQCNSPVYTGPYTASLTATAEVCQD
ncbi:hypothetical protein JCM10003_3383 [Bacteroides pyogenes JCM 10003]|nr:hypothetical protein JCM10003_3383 [Bacteroides pyogenes JCM 10003]